MTTATNYRRKTFATPLDALRWLTAAPLKRKVKNRHGSVVSVGHNYEGVVKFFSDGYSVVVDYNDCPLTAVEDEHGVIEEEPEKPEKVVTFTNGATIRFTGDDGGLFQGIADKVVRQVACIEAGCLEQAAEKKLIKLIDERIAAATVEQHHFPNRDALFSVPGTEAQWIRHDSLRLKPKGES